MTDVSSPPLYASTTLLFMMVSPVCRVLRFLVLRLTSHKRPSGLFCLFWDILLDSGRLLVRKAVEVGFALDGLGHAMDRAVHHVEHVEPERCVIDAVAIHLLHELLAQPIEILLEEG